MHLMEDESAENEDWRPVELRGILASVPELGVEKLELPIQSGLHVFYGLNGAGKSRLLDGIKNGSFDVYAPFAPEGRFTLNGSVGWRTAHPVSFGHEPELHADYAQEQDYFNIDQGNPATSAHLIGDWLEFFSFIDDKYHGEKRDWIWRIVIWVAGLGAIGDAEELLVEAIAEFLDQAQLRVTPHRNEDGTWIPNAWGIQHWVTASPEYPKIWEYVQHGSRKAVNSIAKPGNYGIALSGYFLQHAMLSLDPRTSEGWGQPAPDGRYREFSRNYVVPHGWLRTEFHQWLRTEFVTIITDRPPTNEMELIQYIWEEVRFEGIFTGLEETIDLAALAECRNAGELEVKLFGSGNDIQVHTSLQAICDAISLTATQYFRRLLLNAPDLRLSITPISEWRYRARLAWEMRGARNEWIPVTDGSDTQLRLASMATQLAIRPVPASSAVILMIDEPERGLHRRAEMHLLKGLQSLTIDDPSLTVIVASHSPLFLRPDLAQLHHVTRDTEGCLDVKHLPAATLTNAESLGVSTSELLQLTRIVLLVEGQHDEWVLNGLFGDEFRQMGVRVMSMRGASKLASAAEGQLLFDFTDAFLVVMLDNIDNEKMHRVQNEARVLWNQTLRIDLVEKKLNKLLPSKRMTEASALKDFCIAAIRTGRDDRITFSMLRKRDIPEYFSPSHFLPRDFPQVPTWRELHREHDESKRIDSSTPNFKSWMEATYNARFTKRAFTAAIAAQSSNIHDDLREVLRTVQRVSALVN